MMKERMSKQRDGEPAKPAHESTPRGRAPAISLYRAIGTEFSVGTGGGRAETGTGDAQMRYPVSARRCLINWMV